MLFRKIFYKKMKKIKKSVALIFYFVAYYRNPPGKPSE